MKHAEVVDFRIDEPQIEEVIKKVYEGELDLEDRTVTTV
jgi:ABC-2 type transport system ATP-binding protein